MLFKHRLTTARDLDPTTTIPIERVWKTDLVSVSLACQQCYSITKAASDINNQLVGTTAVSSAASNNDSSPGFTSILQTFSVEWFWRAVIQVTRYYRVRLRIFFTQVTLSILVTLHPSRKKWQHPEEKLNRRYNIIAEADMLVPCSN